MRGMSAQTAEEKRREGKRAKKKRSEGSGAFCCFF